MIRVMKPGTESRIGDVEAARQAREEALNALTHAIGAVLSVIGLGVLLFLALPFGDGWRLAGVAIYGSTLVLLYLASSLYHGAPPGRAKSILNMIDHAAIFLLIAGTYTPFALINMRGTFGFAVFGGIWLLALGGVIFKLVSQHRYARSTVLLYLAMGWLSLFLVDHLLAGAGVGGVLLLLGGGLAYTFGVIFYVWERLPYSHAIWHVFVLKGSALHFLCVLYYALPA